MLLDGIRLIKNMDSFNVVIVDDNLLFRNGLTMELNKLEQIDNIFRFEKGGDFLNFLDSNNPDLVFMDVDMPGMRGDEVTHKAKKKNPFLKVVAMSMTCDQNYLLKMIDAGAGGYILKNIGSTELQLCIDTVLSGKNYFSCDISSKISLSNIKTKAFNIPKFTKREKEIFDYLAKGLTTKQIAEVLYISPRTVECHIAKMESKTNTKTLVNLLIYGLKNSIVSI